MGLLHCIIGVQTKHKHKYVAPLVENSLAYATPWVEDREGMVTTLYMFGVLKRCSSNGSLPSNKLASYS